MHRVVRLALLLLGVVLVLLFSAAPADAHAVLERSDPADGVTLPQAPPQVTLVFSEEIAPAFSTARLVDADGQPVDGAAEAPTDDPRAVVLELPALAQGTYGVIWHVLATDDGHATHGTTTFSVGTQTGVVQLGTDAAGADAGRSAVVTRRWLSVSLLAGVVGALAMAGPVLGAARRRVGGGVVDGAAQQARSRLLLVCACCAGGAVALGVPELMARARQLAPEDGSVAGTAWEVVLRTRWGQLWVLGELALLLLLVLVWRLRRASGRGEAPAVAAVAAVGALVGVRVATEALASHAAALPSWRLLAVVAVGVHVLAALTWLGLVAALAVTAWGSGLSGTERTELLRAARVPFSTLAGTAVAALVVTGLYSAGREVATVDEVSSTAYGRTLLVKVLLLGGLGLLGFLNHQRLHAVVARASGRTIGAEIVVGAALIVAVAVLVETPPVRTAGSPAAAATSARSWRGTLDDLVVTVSVSPGVPGVDGVTVSAASSRRPPPAAVDSVALVLPAAGRAPAVALHRTAEGSWFGTARFDELDVQTARVQVGRGGATVDVAVTAASAATTTADQDEGTAAATATAGRSLASVVDPVASVLLVGSLAGALWLWRRARRPRTQDTEGEADMAEVERVGGFR